MAPVVTTQRVSAGLGAEEGECGKARQLEPLLIDERGFDSAISQKESAVELR